MDTLLLYLFQISHTGAMRVILMLSILSVTKWSISTKKSSAEFCCVLALFSRLSSKTNHRSAVLRWLAQNYLPDFKIHQPEIGIYLSIHLMPQNFVEIFMIM